MYLFAKIKFFLLIILFSNTSFAQNIVIDFKQENQTINQFVKYKVKKYKNLFKIDNIYIAIESSDNMPTHFFGFSNGERNNCKIRLFIDEFDFEDKGFIEFTILHEIAHCHIGKEVIFKNKKTWSIPIDKKEEFKIQRFIDMQTDLVYKGKIQKNLHPNILWHEIYADLIALNWIYEKNKNLDILSNIFERRLNEYNRDPKKTLQPSSLGIKKMIKSIINNSNYNILELADYSFITHMRAIIE